MSGRPYTQKRRAEQAAETRRRIVDATVALHGTVGPARTSLSMIAERAGVQRHTLYAHFPDERSLFQACSGSVMERDPLPDAAAWRELPEPAARLRAGLRDVYGWYRRNAGLAGAVLRDAEVHEATREAAEQSMAPSFRAWPDALGAGLSPAQQAMLVLMLSFFTWRTLTRDAGVADDRVVELAVAAILSAA